MELNTVVFCLDDDVVMGRTISKSLDRENIKNQVFTRSIDLISALHEDVHLCIIDAFLNEAKTGLDVMKQILDLNPFCYVIAMTASYDPRLIVQYIDAGAKHYVLKGEPDFMKTLIGHVKGGIEMMEFFVTLRDKT